MRDIKYKGWNTEQNIMYSEKELGQDELTIDPDGKGFVNVCSSDKKFSEYYSHILPLQYTGKKDNKGIEIYEGDIIIKPANRNRHLEVVFSDDVACFEAIHSVGARSLCGYVNSDGGVLIIGNIYENLELLK